MTELLSRHRQVKQTLLEQLGRLVELCEAAGTRTLAADVRHERIPKLENERFHLVILGEFNHGKSTFVNALLGDSVLPTGITPTTAALNHVVHSDSRAASARLVDGGTIDIAPGAIGDWVTVAGARHKDVRYVEVGHPAEILRDNVTLVDTPGVNDMNEQRAEITYGYVPRADAVIFLLDAGQALKDSEREFLASRVLENTKDRLIFVLGKMDLLSDDDRSSVLAYTRHGLAQFVDQPVVFPISAQRHLNGDTDDSGMSELLDYLGRFLDEDRARLVLDNAAADALRTANYLRQNLLVKERSFELDLKELESRAERVREQLAASRKNLEDLHHRIVAECNSIKAQVHLDLDAFARRFVDALPEQIDLVEADDCKRYLAGFIEDQFREWAELEGEKIASQLEKLAEDVIAITNENVQQAASAVADRLGPAETRVDIDIDSFKYDVAVYSLGALGTTVFLFVSSVAGGLLTLASPILAIILKSKVSGDIREQAKKRAPEAILRAAEALQPHFDKCIDDFGSRLDNFVTSAGTTLYKGITEVLDQAVSERRGREGELEPLRTATVDQRRVLDDVIESVTAARRELWTDGGH